MKMKTINLIFLIGILLLLTTYLLYFVCMRKPIKSDFYKKTTFMFDVPLSLYYEEYGRYPENTNELQSYINKFDIIMIPKGLTWKMIEMSKGASMRENTGCAILVRTKTFCLNEACKIIVYFDRDKVNEYFSYVSGDIDTVPVDIDKWEKVRSGKILNGK